MRQKLLLLLLTAMTAIGVQAQTKMIIHRTSGGDIEINFADKPVATFEGNSMVITTEKTVITVPISNLGETTYEGISTAIIESVTQLSPDAGPSRIYDIDGRLLKTIPVGGPVTFGSLPQGIYIVKNNNSSYKINRK